jgi:phage terminase large subunit GpA-like protein
MSRGIDRILSKTYDGKKISCSCIDAGNWASEVYRFCGPRFYKRVYAIKGSSSRHAAPWPYRPSRPKPGRVSALFIIGALSIKETVFSRLAIEVPGPGFMHFPIGRPLDYYNQLVAERPVRKIVNGVPKRVWVKPSASRCEARDARSYSHAALHALKSMGLNLDRAPASGQSLAEAFAKLNSP